MIASRILRSSAASSSASKVSAKRPMSPHLTIYAPQLTWLMSIGGRFTGAGLAAGLYGGAITYAIVPFTSAAAAASVASLPAAVLFGGKFLVAAPFTYHTFNGVRHLLWDMGYFLSLKGVYSSGYAVLGATAVSSVALACY